MNQRLLDLRQYIFDKNHHMHRRTPESLGLNTLNEHFSSMGLSDVERATERLSVMLENEKPVILPGERIVFTRTIGSIPEIYTPQEWEKIKNSHFIHEKGVISNISPDYEDTLNKGFEAKKLEISNRIAEGHLEEAGLTFLNEMYACICSVQEFIEKYRNYALSIGEEEIATVLCRIKTNGASSFREALQLLRVLHFMLWESANYHNTLGRFDQYMYPFYIHDIENGVVSKEEAFELLLEFFLTCNKDSDLYPGIQQGDNGQSLVLGGMDVSGKDQFNELSEMCLQASLELNLIDPKINIRVNKETPLSVFEKGSELTKIGLGFPQYSNDDVVIPGLVRKGYTYEDACNYTVAACWEFIIPKYGMDIPNIDALSLADCVLASTSELNKCTNYDAFYKLVETEIKHRTQLMCEKHRNIYMEPSPFLSLLMDGCINHATDVSNGCRYNNYGIHGTGIATAVDSLAAIKKFCFETNEIQSEDLISALKCNFVGYEQIQNKLRFEAPKMGQDDDFADFIAKDLLCSFDGALQDLINDKGGIYRAGTGTALFYINHSCHLGATPDGRMAGEAIPANYSPSLFIKQKGPVSVIKSFTKPNLQQTINGGPLTLEFDDTVFNTSESMTKLAMLVKSYISLGGHQIQLNALNKEKLLDAKIHPELYRNLIVRVWGWSGYFVELDEVYQDHVISRFEFSF